MFEASWYDGGLTWDLGQGQARVECQLVGDGLSVQGILIYSGGCAGTRRIAGLESWAASTGCGYSGTGAAAGECGPSKVASGCHAVPRQQHCYSSWLKCGWCYSVPVDVLQKMDGATNRNPRQLLVYDMKQSFSRRNVISVTKHLISIASVLIVEPNKRRTVQAKHLKRLQLRNRASSCGHGFIVCPDGLITQ